MILTRHFLLIVMRECEGIKHPENPKININMNSLAFAGTMAVKNEESLEYIREISPIGLLEKISKKAE